MGHMGTGPGAPPSKKKLLIFNLITQLCIAVATGMFRNNMVTHTVTSVYNLPSKFAKSAYKHL
jgi:hypothetical protein